MSVISLNLAHLVVAVLLHTTKPNNFPYQQFPQATYLCIIILFQVLALLVGNAGQALRLDSAYTPDLYSLEHDDYWSVCCTLNRLEAESILYSKQQLP